MTIRLGAAGLLEVGDEVEALLLLLEAREDHLGAGDVLLRVLEVHVEGLLVPGDALLGVGLGVGVAGGLAGLATEHSAEVGSLLVALALQVHIYA